MSDIDNNVNKPSLVTINGNDITLTDPVIVNGTTYATFTMKAPSYSEVMLNYDAIEKAGTQAGQVAMAKLARICTTNLVKTSDFDALPFRVVAELQKWVGENLVF